MAEPPVSPTAMMQQAVSYVLKVDATQAVQALNQLVQSIQRDGQEIDKLQKILDRFAQLAGVNVKAAADSFKAMEGVVPGISKAIDGLGTATASTTTATTEATQASTGFSGALGGLLTVANAVSTALGIGLYQVIRGIIDYFKQATQAGLDFSQSLFELEVGVRAAQKSGLDVSIAQYKKEIADLQKQYPTLSMAEVTKGYAQILLLGRDLGFTADKIKEVATVSATAAVVLNKDFGETAIGITKSLSSGWFEAAQRAGFLISRQAVVNEGLKIGIKNAESGYNAMTEQERAEAALSVYVRENTKIQEDAGAVMETNAGRVKAMQAAWQNFTTYLGSAIAPAIAGLADKLRNLISPESLTEQTKNMSALEAALYRLTHPNLGEAMRAWQQFWAIIGAGWLTLKEFADALKKGNIAGDWGDAWRKMFAENWQKAVGQVGLGGAEILGDFKGLGEQAGDAFGEGLSKATKDAWDKFNKTLKDEQADTANKIEQMQVDLNRKLADLNDKWLLERNRKEQDYNNKVADAQQNLNDQLADANANYQENQLKAEEDYQKKLHELRDRYLLDLEDALRKRDASQVIRLMKQYQMERDNITSDKKTQDAQAARDHEKELARIRRESAQRLAQMARDHAIEMARLKEDNQRAIDEANKRYKQDLEDLATASKNKLQIMLQSLVDEGVLTQQEYDKMQVTAQTYLNNLGTMYGAYARGIINIINSVKAAMAGLNAAPLVPPGSKEGYQNYPSNKWNTYQQDYGTKFGHAKGGIFHADKPTPAIFGEAGGETAIFIPDSQMTRNVSASRITNVSNTQNVSNIGGGEMKVWVMLDQDLIGRIETNTIGKVAGVVNQVRRERR